MFSQAIKTKFLGPTTHKGARVKAICHAGSITLSWNYELNQNANHALAIQRLADKLGWEGELSFGWDNNSLIGVFNDMSELLKVGYGKEGN